MMLYTLLQLASQENNTSNLIFVNLLAEMCGAGPLFWMNSKPELHHLETV